MALLHITDKILISDLNSTSLVSRFHHNGATTVVWTVEGPCHCGVEGPCRPPAVCLTDLRLPLQNSGQHFFVQCFFLNDRRSLCPTQYSFSLHYNRFVGVERVGGTSQGLVESGLRPAPCLSCALPVGLLMRNFTELAL